MQKIGSITSTADANGDWTNGNVAAGTSPTIIEAEWLNTIQNELVNVVTGAGLTLNPKDNTQVLAALKKLFLQSANNFSEIKNAGPAAVAAALSNLGLGDVTGYVGRKIAERWITQSGPYIPSPGAKRIRVTLIGGGAGGGGGQGNSNGYVSAGSGGGAGGVSRKTIDLTSASPFQLTIGVGGRAGVFSSDQPGDGGVSTFGSNMVAYGGGRGSNCGSVAFGVTQLVANGGGGISSGGDINTIGGSGGAAIILGQGYVSGGGGNSVVAGGGQPITTSVSTNGIDGSYGSGGSGAYVLAGGSEKIGGRGGDGVCIIEEYA